MNKKYLMSLLMLCSVFSLSGCCYSSEPLNITGPIQISEAQNNIKVSASSEVTVVPDKAKISLGVESTKYTANEAQDDTNDKISNVISKLKELGIEESNIKTSNYSLSPVYSWKDNERKLDGYSSNVSLEVTGIDIDKVGEIISGGVSSGANNVYDVRYECSNYDEIYADTLADAINKAHEKAEKMAEVSGVALEKVSSIEEGYQNTSARYVYNYNDTGLKMSAMEETDSVEEFSIMPGELNIEAEVIVVYSIK